MACCGSCASGGECEGKSRDLSFGMRNPIGVGASISPTQAMSSAAPFAIGAGLGAIAGRLVGGLFGWPGIGTAIGAGVGLYMTPFAVVATLPSA